MFMDFHGFAASGAHLKFNESLKNIDVILFSIDF